MISKILNKLYYYYLYDFKKIILILLIFLPIPIFLFYFYKLSFIDLLTVVNFYYLISFSFWQSYKFYTKNKAPRFPFYFIKRFNSSGNPKDWTNNSPFKELIGVEVGVHRGMNVKRILNHLNIKKLYLVDPWTGLDEKEKSDQQKIYSEVLKEFSNNSKIEIIRKKSLDACKDFEDLSLDFVYVDGDHSYESVKQDLNHWYPKIKNFGVICGDDYGHFSGKGVIKAVDEFSFEKKIISHIGEGNQFYFIKSKH